MMKACPAEGIEGMNISEYHPTSYELCKALRESTNLR